MLCVEVVRLFGNKLDRKDGMQLDEDTYMELKSVTYNINKRHINTKRSHICLAVAKKCSARQRKSKNANQFNKAVESSFREELILVMDQSSQTIITGFAASKKMKRLKRY